MVYSKTPTKQEKGLLRGEGDKIDLVERRQVAIFWKGREGQEVPWRIEQFGDDFVNG